MTGWTKESRQAAQEARKDPAVRAKQSSSQKGRAFTEEHKAKLRKPKIIRMDPVEYSRIKSEATSRNWLDPEYRKKVLISPSKLELSLVPAMEALGYWHSGAGDFWIHHEGRTRNPDFKAHGSKRVVELYGTYWHRNERGLEQETIDWYRDAGFDCIIVWEDEIERLEELVA